MILRMAIWMVALMMGVNAEVPRKAPLTKYKKLVDESPFTSKPPPAEVVAAGNPLEDYALCGISPIAGGYRVTLINKKKPEEQIVVESNVAASAKGFRILEVKRQDGNPLGTVVKMASGSQEGTVAFDEKYLGLAAAPVAKNPAGQMNKQPGVPQPVPQPVLPPGSRPRVIPAPTLGNPSAGGHNH